METAVLQRAIGADGLERELEALYRITGSLSASPLDLDATVQEVTDVATQSIDAEFGAFFYNVVNDEGESYLLYSLSGVPKEAFAKFGLPRNTPLFHATFSGESIVRVDDVTKDPRYGQMAPHYGMPPGHLPVRSYLAVPVRSRRGTIFGGLFFGHAETGRFTARHERLVSTVAAYAAAAIESSMVFRSMKRAERAQTRLVAELRETVRMNDVFAGVLAHDLRNPLGAMLTSGDLLASKIPASSEPETKAVRRLLSSGWRMNRMVEQLLDFTRIRTQGMPLDPQPANLETIVREAIEESAAGQPPTSVVLRCQGDALGAWDDDRLGQLFSNLVRNALHHGAGDAPVDVRIDGRDRAFVRVEVQNQGAVPGDLIPKLFEPFSGGQKRPSKNKGLGLGLFISLEIARAHGGTIELRADEHGGTTIATVTLPRHAELPTGDPTTLTEDHLDPMPDHLWQAEERNRLLIESIRDYSIFMLDPEGRVASWTPAAERIHGYTAGEIVGKPVSTFYPPDADSAAKAAAELQKAMELGRFEEEDWRVRKDGTRYWASVITIAMRDATGRAIGFATVARDLTERRKAEDALSAERVRTARAEEAVRLRDEFLALVSHELRTPLASLLIQLEAVRDKSDSCAPDVTLRIERAARSSQRLAALVESMLDATSIINGRLDLTREPQDLGDIVRETLEDLRGAIERAGCDLLTHLDRSVLGRWDRVRVRQIVANLVSNAIKYGAGRPVEVATYADGQYGVLEVRDHGKGIPEHERERIFGPFERAASIRNYGGLGLGLFVVQQIVAAHGGDVVADNATDGGARLRVRLPLDPEADMARSPSLPESLACPPPTVSSSSRTTT